MSKDYPCVYWNDGRCKKFSYDDITSWCVWNSCDSQTPSNADKIRAMSDEELAKLLCCTGWRMIEQKECLEWLQQPAEEDDHE